MRRLWTLLVTVMAVSFAVLGWMGLRIRANAPPVADRVMTADGQVVVAAGDIAAGQNVWQSMGGMEMGSIWGHGSYVAPDWTADWLHRESTAVLDAWARAEHGAPYASLDPATAAGSRERLRAMMRANTYDPGRGAILVDPARAAAIRATAAHFEDVFSRGRADYAIPSGAQTDPVRLRQLSAFIFWTAWAATTERPGAAVTYTNNWPYEPLVGNTLTGDAWITRLPGSSRPHWGRSLGFKRNRVPRLITLRWLPARLDFREQPLRHVLHEGLRKDQSARLFRRETTERHLGRWYRQRHHR